MGLGRTLAKGAFLTVCAGLGITGGVYALDKFEDKFSKNEDAEEKDKNEENIDDDLEDVEEELEEKQEK